MEVETPPPGSVAEAMDTDSSPLPVISDITSAPASAPPAVVPSAVPVPVRTPLPDTVSPPASTTPVAATVGMPPAPAGYGSGAAPHHPPPLVIATGAAAASGGQPSPAPTSASSAQGSPVIHPGLKLPAHVRGPPSGLVRQQGAGGLASGPTSPRSFSATPIPPPQRQHQHQQQQHHNYYPPPATLASQHHHSATPPPPHSSQQQQQQPPAPAPHYPYQSHYRHQPPLMAQPPAQYHHHHHATLPSQHQQPQQPQHQHHQPYHHAQTPPVTTPASVASSSAPPPSKPLIMDPPAAKVPARIVSVTGFPSPIKDYAKENPKWVADVSRLTFAVQQSLPEAIRRVVRDNWEKCLLGSEFHQAFIMNATIHHATGEITRRAIRDFGEKMVAETKYELANQLKPADLDDIADILLEKASNRFLDKALERRLRTIEAKPLIHALARAERLGYEPSDIIEDNERVVPDVPQYAVPSYAPEQVPAPSSKALGAQPEASRPVANGSSETWHCGDCFRQFTVKSAYDHHVKKSVCTRQPIGNAGFKYQCLHCGQGFTTIVGLQYHNANKVCGDFTATNTAATPPPTVIDLTQPALTPGVRVVQGPSPPVVISSAGRRDKFMIAAAATTPPAPAVPGDPYGHLTPEARSRMEAELKAAEESFSGRFREAEQMQDPAEAKTRLDSLKNSYNTKQSMIRKKFGVRLRERRTRAQIEEERQRMGLKGIYPTSSPSAAGSAVSRSASRAASGPVIPSQISPVPLPSRSSWTSVNAAPTTSEQQQQQQGTKRRRTDSGFTSSQETAAHPNSDDAGASGITMESYQKAGHRVQMGGAAAVRSSSSSSSNHPGAATDASVLAAAAGELFERREALRAQQQLQREQAEDPNPSERPTDNDDDGDTIMLKAEDTDDENENEPDVEVAPLRSTTFATTGNSVITSRPGSASAATSSYNMSGIGGGDVRRASSVGAAVSLAATAAAAVRGINRNGAKQQHGSSPSKGNDDMSSDSDSDTDGDIPANLPSSQQRRGIAV